MTSRFTLIKVGDTIKQTMTLAFLQDGQVVSWIKDSLVQSSSDGPLVYVSTSSNIVFLPTPITGATRPLLLRIFYFYVCDVLMFNV